MSYILEALKKAEAEREKGQVPSLHSQEWASQAAPPTARFWTQWSRGVLGLLVVAAAGLGLALWFQSAGPESPLLAQAEQGPTLMPSAAATASQVSAAAQQAPQSTAAPLPTPAPNSVAGASAPTKPTEVKRSASAASAPERVLAWLELPASARQKLPKLQWGGAMYSPDPSARMVIINDQVLREGDQVAAGVTLERIEAKAVVLKLQGQRVRWGG